jgi:hypothetical protein
MSQIAEEQTVIESNEIDISDEIVDTAVEETEEAPKILRTAENGCWEIYQGAWGSYLRQTFDPDANAVVTEDHLKHFELNPNIHRIPAELWAKWIRVCFHYVDKVAASLEVSMRILRNEQDPTQYRFVIPRQKVSGAAVRVDSFDECIDLDTGEEFTSYPPEGWIPVGSSHSHNTMAAFFSGTDDKYELGDPGIHIVVGSINTTTMKYHIASSVVGNHRRFTVDYDKLIDATPVPGADFHPKVIDYVDYTSPVTTYSAKGGTTVNYPSSWVSKTSKSKVRDYKKYGDLQNWGWYYGDSDNDYSDPFYWSSDTSKKAGSGDIPQVVQVWNMIDLIRDYIRENPNNTTVLTELREDLIDLAADADSFLESFTIV